MIDIKQIGIQIRKIRNNSGLTQQAFADAVGVSFQAVSNWERGITPPDLHNLVNIAECFGVLIDDLLRPDHEDLILGIDGGGTKTAFAVTTYDGMIVKYFTEAASNPNDIGVKETFDIIFRGILEALDSHHSISTVFCGIAGVATGGQATYLARELKKKFPNKKIVVKSDYENIFAMDEKSDIAIISGTGSVVCVRKGDTYAHIGGWGYLFDKAGSAYDIGREVVFAALEEEELCKPHSLISDLLKKQMGVSTVRSIIGSLYKEGKPCIASLANIAFLAYKEGDSKAYKIIDENAARLGDLLNAAVEIHHVSPRAIAGGGIFEHHGEIMLNHLSKYTDVEIILPECPPVYGACVQSRKLVGEGIPEDFRRNFISSYEGVVK